MKNSEILSFFQTIRNNYALMQAGALFLSATDAAEKFDEYYSLISDHPEARFGYIRYVFFDDKILSHSLEELRKSVLRSSINETYELLRSNFRQKEEKDILNSSECYHFLRIIRNSFSHDCRFKFTNFDNKFLPLSWNSIIITSEMDGEFVPIDGFLTRDRVLKLLDDIYLLILNNF